MRAVTTPRRPSLTWVGFGIVLLLLAVAANVAAEGSLLVHLAVQPVAIIHAARHIAVPGGFPYGTALAVGADGQIYVAERSPAHVRVFDSEGREQAVWDGRDGTPTLRDPTALSVLPDGRIALLDVADHGAALLTCPADGRHCASVQIATLAKPQGLAPRQAGGFLIADTANNRDNGVFPYPFYARDWDGRFGRELGQQYLQTIEGTRYQISGNFANAGTITMLTNDLVPTQSLFTGPNATGAMS